MNSNHLVDTGLIVTGKKIKKKKFHQLRGQQYCNKLWDKRYH